MLAKTDGCYAAIYDELSPVHVEGSIPDLLEPARIESEADDRLKGLSIFVLLICTPAYAVKSSWRGRSAY
jgi:hypothetical protein